MDYKDKKVLVIGAGVSGVGAARALARVGANAILSDPKALSAELTSALTALGVECVFGPQQSGLLAGVDYVVVSPGIALGIPIIDAAEKAGIPVIAEIELAYQLAKAPIYAVTGTNGKTTTTSLLGDMVAAAGIPYVMGGNIGSALSESVLDLQEDGIIVAEISSFQLETIKGFRPKAAVVLNITPDHTERHGTMEEYVRVKGRITENQTVDDVLLLNKNDKYCKQIEAKAACQVYELDTYGVVPRGAYILDDMLCLKVNGEVVELVKTNELQIKGRHNWENALAASFLAYMAKVPLRVIRGVLRAFKGLPHRIEPVGEVAGVVYYNDSKATNTDATVQAIKGFAEPIIWIAGGYDKGTDLSDLMETAKVCAGVIFMGAAKERFLLAAKTAGLMNVACVETLAEAVALAAKQAKELQAKVVLFSPACSSYDMFKNYRERGIVFKDIVKAMRD